jgi:hypothetical protein
MTVREIYEQHIQMLSPEKRLELGALIAQETARRARSEPPSTHEALEPPPEDRPISELGRRLRVIRARMVSSGEPLLDEEGVLREVAERRGGLSALEWRDEGK